mgnify:CR=1 FL=1
MRFNGAARVCGAVILLVGCGANPRLDRSGAGAFTRSTALLAAEMAQASAPGDAVTIREDLALEVRRARDGERFVINLTSPWAWCGENAGDCDDGTTRYLQQALDRVAIAEGGGVLPADAPAKP